MAQDLRTIYKETVKTADKVLSAGKLLDVDLRHDRVAESVEDAEILAFLLRTWMLQLHKYRDAAEKLWKDIDAELEATIR